MAKYINVPTPVLFTDSTTTNSGLYNKAGYVLSPKTTFTYSPLTQINPNVYLKNKLIALDSYGIEYSYALLPITKETFSKTTVSGTIPALGFYYFSWAEVSKTLFQIYSDSLYIYAATTEGLDIYNIETSLLVCTKNIPNQQVITICGNQTHIYFGTSNGIYSIYIYDITTNCRNASIHKENFSLQSNNIKYLHLNQNDLAVCTDKSVEYINLTSSGNPTYTYINNAFKCYITKKSLYYITTSGNLYNLNYINNYKTNWVIPTKYYSTNGTIFKENIKLTDIYITEKTTTSGLNTIFCTTTSGLYIINEDNDFYLTYYLI